jgi:hypothetical protein
MTLKPIDFEAGPEGADLSQANTGAQQVTVNGGSAKFSTRLVRSGTLGARIVSVANALAIARYQFAATNLVASLNYPFTVEAAPPSNFTTPFSLRFASGVACRLNWYPDNSLGITDAAAGSLLTLGTGLTPGAGYEVSIRAKAATSTTGTITVVLYNAAGVELGRVTSAAYNLGTNPFAAVDVGIVNTNPAAGTAVAFDYLQLNDGSTAELRAPQATPAYTGTAALTGSGTLTGAGAPGTAATGALSGTGSLTATGTPRTAASAAQGGTGSLTGTGSPQTGSTATLNGVGSLTASGAPAALSTASLSSSGALSAAARAVMAGQVDLAGAGTLTALGTPAHAGAAALVGDGILTGVGTPTMTALASLSGTGTLTGAPTVVGHDITVTATLGPRRHGSTLGAPRTSSSLGSRRWESHL